VNATVTVTVSESPLTTAREAVNAADARNSPAVDASQSEMCVIVSDVVIENAGMLDDAFDPADAADQVTC
jgi:hypothetical protein